MHYRLHQRCIRFGEPMLSCLNVGISSARVGIGGFLGV